MTLFYQQLSFTVMNYLIKYCLICFLADTVGYLADTHTPQSSDVDTPIQSDPIRR